MVNATKEDEKDSRLECSMFEITQAPEVEVAEEFKNALIGLVLIDYKVDESALKDNSWIMGNNPEEKEVHVIFTDDFILAIKSHNKKKGSFWEDYPDCKKFPFTKIPKRYCMVLAHKQ